MERRGKHTSSATCYRDFDHDGSLFAKLYTIDFDANESAVESFFLCIVASMDPLLVRSFRRVFGR
jgi:hypothetical protein